MEFVAGGVEDIITDLRISGGSGRGFRRRCRWQRGGRNRGWTEGNNGGLRDRGGAAGGEEQENHDDGGPEEPAFIKGLFLLLHGSGNRGAIIAGFQAGGIGQTGAGGRDPGTGAVAAVLGNAAIFAANADTDGLLAQVQLHAGGKLYAVAKTKRHSKTSFLILILFV